MKCLIVTLMICVRYTTSQFIPIPKLNSACETTKNSLVEHFFNVIFTEFYTTPPVCVCVQMCAGQSTYCYPNGCLKRDDLQRVDSPLVSPQAKGDRRQYMFVVDEKNDFMKEYLEKTFDDQMTMTPGREIREMRPDVFKDKNNMFGKHKKVPNVELRYNLREQVKNMKSDLLKIEAGDFSKTRWPMNKRNLISGHKIQSKLEKRTPIIGKANYFMAMLPANDISGYPLKYFKRDIAKSFNDESNVKEMYLLENSENDTERNTNETYSLETLIENLINNSFQTKKQNTREDVTTENEAKINETYVKATENYIDTTKALTTKHTLYNETMDVISINSTNEKVDKNKYSDDFQQFHESNSSNIFNEMIKSLSKRIEKQNNTSLEIAKRVVGDYGNDETTAVNIETTERTFEPSLNETVADRNTDTSEQITTPITDFTETLVTMKYRPKKTHKRQKHTLK